MTRTAAAAFTFILLAAGPACNKKMQDGRFIETYVRLTRVSARYTGQPDSLATARQKIFKETGMTETAFNAYADRYRDRPEKWTEIWKAIQKEMDRRKNGDTAPVKGKEKRTGPEKKPESGKALTRKDR